MLMQGSLKKWIGNDGLWNGDVGERTQTCRAVVACPACGIAQEVGAYYADDGTPIPKGSCNASRCDAKLRTGTVIEHYE